MNPREQNRPLSAPEMSLARWMLEHGNPEAKAFLEQLEVARVTPWRCPCGCGSISFQIEGREPAPSGVHILGDFIFQSDKELAGIFIYENTGLLSGIEVYGFAGDAPRALPKEEELRFFASGADS